MSSYIDINENLCRICLTAGAIIPIFETNEVTKENIQSKIFKCVNQKIEDIMGFPRHICTPCNSTLNSICDFLKKLIETSKALHLGLQTVKKECLLSDESDDNDTFQDDCLKIPEAEIEKETKVIEIKLEPEVVDVHDFGSKEADHLKKLLNLDLQIKRIKFEPLDSKLKQKWKKKQPIVKAKNKTNKIASAILEGNFEWTGNKWCLINTERKKKINKNNRAKTKEPNKEKKIPHREPHREPQIKVPKEKSIPAPKLCDHCGQTFTNADQFRRHKESHKEVTRSEKCPQCDFISTSKQNVRKHMIVKHSVNKKFICDVCGKKFPLKHFLTAHLKNVHNDGPKKIYPCTMCEKTYYAPKSVEVHIRSAHTGDRPAVCTVCDASFFAESYLREHMRLHTGETPFKCPICGRGYAQRGNMKSHILHNHRKSQLTEEQLSTIKPTYLRIMKD